MTTRQSLLALLVSSAVTASACGGGSPEQTPPASAPVESSAPAPAPEPQAAPPPVETPRAPQAAPAPPASARPPAFTRTDTKVGTGREATAGRQISMHYTGWLYDPARPEQKGQQFDSSVDRREPFMFTLGIGQVIPGWDRGIVGMKVGGKRRLVIPPDLGYGESGFGGGLIPPNATLIFETELLDVL